MKIWRYIVLACFFFGAFWEVGVSEVQNDLSPGQHPLEKDGPRQTLLSQEMNCPVPAVDTNTPQWQQYAQWQKSVHSWDPPEK